MQYSYYNPVNENGGCVARALSKAFNKNYDEIKEELYHIAKDLNYEDYREIDVFEKYMFDRDAICIKEYENTKIEDFDLENGTYILFAYKDDFYHLTCIKDNILYDKDDKIMDLIILKVYQIKNRY